MHDIKQIRKSPEILDEALKKKRRKRKKFKNYCIRYPKKTNNRKVRTFAF